MWISPSKETTWRSAKTPSTRNSAVLLMRRFCWLMWSTKSTGPMARCRRTRWRVQVHPLSRALLPFCLIPLEKHRRVNSFFSDLKGTARIFLLTKNRVFLADQKTGQVKASVPLPDLASVSVSTQADGFFALKLKEVRNIPHFLPSHLNQITARLVPFRGLSFARAILQMFQTEILILFHKTWDIPESHVGTVEQNYLWLHLLSRCSIRGIRTDQQGACCDSSSPFVWVD